MIPGIIIAVLTFPGVIVHEIAHQFFCRIYRVAVLDVSYFRLGNPAGYIVHESVREPWKQTMIAVGPFLVNSIVGALIALPGAIPVLQFGTGSFLDYVLVWLGVSIATHSFPSPGDGRDIWHALWADTSSSLAKFLGTPLVGLIYLGAFGSAFCLNVFWGVGVAALLPRLIVWIAA